MRKQDFELRGDLRPEYTLPRIMRSGKLRPEYNLPNVPARKGAHRNAVVARIQKKAQRDKLIADEQNDAPTIVHKDAQLPPAQSTATDMAVTYLPVQEEQYKPPATEAFEQAPTVADGVAVQLDADVAAAFPNREAVNNALRLVMQLAKIPE